VADKTRKYAYLTLVGVGCRLLCHLLRQVVVFGWRKIISGWHGIWAAPFGLLVVHLCAVLPSDFEQTVEESGRVVVVETALQRQRQFVSYPAIRPEKNHIAMRFSGTSRSS
jgi:hypothetical protein